MEFKLPPIQNLSPSKLSFVDADITSRYIVIRSQYHMKDGYEFRENSPSMGAFDIQEVGRFNHL